MPGRVLFEFNADEKTGGYRFKVNLSARHRRARNAEGRGRDGGRRHGWRGRGRRGQEQVHRTLELLEKLYSELYRDDLI